MPKSAQIVRTSQHRGITIPSFFFGTAWKENRTESLVTLALQNGFRSVDTANQRKHYFEAGVGAALKHFLNEGHRRAELFLQTKFTFQAGQDHRLPYDPSADYQTQVQQSFASSLEHLGTDYLDSYILHGPASGSGLTEADWQVWRAMEGLQKSGQVRLLGVSNINETQLKLLLDQAEITPAFVQNRCYARTLWDGRIREICQAQDIKYQGFSLLTANAHELADPKISAIAKKHTASIPQLVFRFALQIGMLPLTGTTNPEHMAMDLDADTITLSNEELKVIEKIAID